MLPTVTNRLDGAERLAKNLEDLGPRATLTVLRPALRAAAGVVAKSERASIPRGLGDVKRAIGSRVMKTARQTQLQAKAGGGVGKARAAKLHLKRGVKKAGVGISANNIHWYTLGTQERYTGSKSSGGNGRHGKKRKRVVYKTGHATAFRGRMPAHSLRAAATAARPAAAAVLRQMIQKGINREWAKRNKAGSRF